MTNIAGTWRYRSFLNDARPVISPEDALALIFGEGDLVIASANPGQEFRATLSFGEDAVMDLKGEVSKGEPIAIVAKGRGRPGGPIADFAYDYIFFEVPSWPEGIGQVPALVGSVVRVEDHGEARKGVTASTITILQEG